MAQSAKKKAAPSPEEFVLMGRTRSLLNEIWGIWRDSLGRTPDVAKRMIEASVKELHKAEKPIVKAKKKVAKKAGAKKAAVKKAVAKKVKAAKRKVK